MSSTPLLEQPAYDKQSLPSTTSSERVRRQRRPRRFLVFGPKAPEKNSRQCFGKRMRFYAFWIAVMQIGVGVGCFVLGLSRMEKLVMQLDLSTVGIFAISSLILVKTGVDGIKCTINRGRTEENGLGNERRLERVIIWAWASGLVAILLLVGALSNIDGSWTILLLMLVPTPVLGFGAYVAWAYKEQTLRAVLVMVDDGVDTSSSAKNLIDPDAPHIEPSKNVVEANASIWPPPDLERGSKSAFTNNHYDKKSNMLTSDDDDDDDSFDTNQYNHNTNNNASIWQSATPTADINSNHSTPISTFVPAINLALFTTSLRSEKKRRKRDNDVVKPFFTDSEAAKKPPEANGYNPNRNSLQQNDSNPFQSEPILEQVNVKPVPQQSSFEFNLFNDAKTQNGTQVSGNPFDTGSNPFDSYSHVEKHNPFDTQQPQKSYTPFESTNSANPFEAKSNHVTSQSLSDSNPFEAVPKYRGNPFQQV